jgi:hypothetical protein
MTKKILYLANQKVLNFFPDVTTKESLLFTLIGSGIEKQNAS